MAKISVCKKGFKIHSIITFISSCIWWTFYACSSYLCFGLWCSSLDLYQCWKRLCSIIIILPQLIHCLCVLILLFLVCSCCICCLCVMIRQASSWGVRHLHALIPPCFCYVCCLSGLILLLIIVMFIVFLVWFLPF